MLHFLLLKAGTWIELSTGKISIMKIIIGIKKTVLPFFLSFLILSCSDAPNKAAKEIDSAKIATNNDRKSKETIPAAPGKSIQKKWTANASAAQIKFSVKGPFGTVHGSFSGLMSTILFDEDNLAASSILASVVVKSINTGIGLRNKDLQKEKYFNADAFPSISFKSNKIKKSGTGFKAMGNLTIKGITKNVEIPFSFSGKGNAGTFKGNFTLQRADYGIGKAGGSIGDTVTIELEVPVTK